MTTPNDIVGTHTRKGQMTSRIEASMADGSIQIYVATITPTAAGFFWKVVEEATGIILHGQGPCTLREAVDQGENKLSFAKNIAEVLDRQPKISQKGGMLY